MSAIATDPERGLNDARRRGHRRLVLRRAVALLAIVALVALVFAAPAVWDLVRDQRNRPATTLNPPPMSGTYTTTVTAQDTADAGMPGRWLLSLDRDGTLRLSSLSDGDLHPSVTRYRTRGSEFLTTALAGDGCSGVGRYEWSRDGSILTFSVVADPCSPRASIFASHPWSPTLTTAFSSEATPASQILGNWRTGYTCEGLVRAFERAGIGELAPWGLVRIGLQEGPVARLESSGNVCESADRFVRTHLFRSNGYLLNRQDGVVADDCRCYVLVDDRTLVVVGGPGSPDIALRYRIGAGSLSFEAVMPDQCSSATCRGQFAFAVSQYAVGPWQRVTG
jgi:hypothetical protein